jgi:hypothetical protein
MVRAMKLQAVRQEKYFSRGDRNTLVSIYEGMICA